MYVHQCKCVVGMFSLWLKCSCRQSLVIFSWQIPHCYMYMYMYAHAHVHPCTFRCPQSWDTCSTVFSILQCCSTLDCQLPSVVFTCAVYVLRFQGTTVASCAQLPPHAMGYMHIYMCTCTCTCNQCEVTHQLTHNECVLVDEPLQECCGIQKYCTVSGVCTRYIVGRMQIRL